MLIIVVYTFCQLSDSCQWSYNPLRFPRFPGDRNGSNCKLYQSRSPLRSFYNYQFVLENNLEI